jgi:hypothetical protein
MGVAGVVEKSIHLFEPAAPFEFSMLIVRARANEVGRTRPDEGLGLGCPC